MSPKTLVAILAPIMAFMSWVFLATLLLLYGNDWWLSGLTTFTVFAWLAGLLVVIYQQGSIRAAATGAMIASSTYWLLALGPWFSTNVGHTLLTSRLLAHAEQLLPGKVPQTQMLTWASPTPTQFYGSGSPYNISGSGAVSGQLTFSPQVTTILTTPVPLAGSVFQSLGHWLFIWLVGALGAYVAFFMHKRAQRKAKPGPSPLLTSAAGESPFALTTCSSPSEEKSAPSGGAA